MCYFEAFLDLFNLDSETEWSRRLFDHLTRFGYELALFAVLPDSETPLEDAHIWTTYPDDWRAIYVKQNMAYFDPTVMHSLTLTTPLIWEPKIFASKAAKQMYEEACLFGLRSGITVPMHGPHSAVGMLCAATDSTLGAARRKDIGHNLPNIVLLRDMALETSQDYLGYRTRSPVPRLTPREKECLTWVAIGKSSWDISKILRCSEATVNFHMGNVRQKMNVNSRVAAAAKAVRLGLISL